MLPADIRRVFHCYMLSVESNPLGPTVTEFPTYSKTVVMRRISGLSGPRDQTQRNHRRSQGEANGPKSPQILRICSHFLV